MSTPTVTVNLNRAPIATTITDLVPDATIDAAIIAPGTQFNMGDWCSSPNNEYVLVLVSASGDSSGDLVLYELSGEPSSGSFKDRDYPITFQGLQLWDSKTGNISNTANYFQVQHNAGTNGTDTGNLVVYNSDKTPLWKSDTNNTQIAGLYLQDDGNLVLYKLDSCWNSDTKQS
ncbi:MAG: hypothetical protein ACKVZH_10845 [Blastocatellia bacterium]